MNRPFKISRASGPPVSGAQPAAPVSPLAGAAPSIGAGSNTARNSPTVAAGAPNRDTYLDDGYGLQSRCITCRKGMSNCLCDAPDIDVPGVEQMKRVMPHLFADDEDAALVYVERIASGRIAC